MCWNGQFFGGIGIGCMPEFNHCGVTATMERAQSSQCSCGCGCGCGCNSCNSCNSCNGSGGSSGCGCGG